MTSAHVGWLTQQGHEIVCITGCYSGSVYFLVRHYWHFYYASTEEQTMQDLKVLFQKLCFANYAKSVEKMSQYDYGNIPNMSAMCLAERDLLLVYMKTPQGA